MSVSVVSGTPVPWPRLGPSAQSPSSEMLASLPENDGFEVVPLRPYVATAGLCASSESFHSQVVLKEVRAGTALSRKPVQGARVRCPLRHAGPSLWDQSQAPREYQRIKHT